MIGIATLCRYRAGIVKRLLLTVLAAALTSSCASVAPVLTNAAIKFGQDLIQVASHNTSPRYAEELEELLLALLRDQTGIDIEKKRKKDKRYSQGGYPQDPYGYGDSTQDPYATTGGSDPYGYGGGTQDPYATTGGSDPYGYGGGTQEPYATTGGSDPYGYGGGTQDPYATTGGRDPYGYGGGTGEP